MGELLKTIELEDQPLMERLVSWVIRIPKLRPLVVSKYLVLSCGWQCSEETVMVEVVVPILHVVRRVGWRERSVVSYRFFREMHFSQGPSVVWSQQAEVLAVAVWT